MNELEEKLVASWPPSQWRDVTVLVAVSGGPDSVALARALGAIRSDHSGKLVFAHFNHGIRGPEADEDETFVGDLAVKLGVDHVSGRATEIPLAAGEGLEAAMRRQRYAFLEASASELGARFVVTAHTADDQAETILHRIFRGTGIAGLQGIPRARPFGPAALIRPLMFARRHEIIAYLNAIGQEFRIDRSNNDLQFRRNWLRQELFPRVTQVYGPQAVDALVRLGEMASESCSFVAPSARALLMRAICSKTPTEVILALDTIAAEPEFLVREMFMTLWRDCAWPLGQMGHARWVELALFAMNRGEKSGNLIDGAAAESLANLPGGICATKKGGKLTLFRPANLG